MFVIEHLLFVLGTFCISFSTFFLHSLFIRLFDLLLLFWTFDTRMQLHARYTFRDFIRMKFFSIEKNHHNKWNKKNQNKPRKNERIPFHMLYFLLKNGEKKNRLFFFLEKKNFPFLLLLLLTSFYEISIWKSGKKSEKIFSIEF